MQLNLRFVSVGVLVAAAILVLGDRATAQVGGSVTGITPTKVTCRNSTTGQVVTASTSGPTWDCVAMGLVVDPGDHITETVLGKAGCGSGIDPTGLIGLWHFDGNTDDSSGNGNNGTISGAGVKSITTGVKGKAYHFNGVDNIDVGNLDFSGGEYSVTVWIRTSVAGSHDNFKMAIGKGNTSVGDMTFELFLGDGDTSVENDGVYIVWSSGTGVAFMNPARPDVSLRNGKWHMLTGTYATGAQRFYVDGQPVASDSYGGPLPLVGDNVKIGGFNGFGPYHHPWNGDIDEVSIYGRVLSSAEVLQLYQFTKCGS
jgi:hypothetical protein